MVYTLLYIILLVYIVCIDGLFIQLVYTFIKGRDDSRTTYRLPATVYHNQPNTSGDVMWNPFNRKPVSAVHPPCSCGNPGQAPEAPEKPSESVVPPLRPCIVVVPKERADKLVIATWMMPGISIATPSEIRKMRVKDRLAELQDDLDSV